MALEKILDLNIKPVHYTVEHACVICLDCNLDRDSDAEGENAIREIRSMLGGGSIDFIKIPGGLKSLTRPLGAEALDGFVEYIRVVLGHQPKVFNLFLHEDCGAYGADFPADTESELMEARTVLLDILEKLGYEAEVRAFFIRWDGILKLEEEALENAA